MRALALISGIIGGLCIILSVITVAEVIPLVYVGFSGIYWLALGGVFFLVSIMCLVDRSSGD
ncbi:hypothetical protein ACFLTP_05750 [Chloroflexota bacterium]